MTGPPAADPDFVIVTRTRTRTRTGSGSGSGSGWRIVVVHLSAALIASPEVL